ncbi:hypothetical protein COD17_09435 [Bacillus thuringiensis]|nr:hypothetical protein COD17_09435 [Bacillus thuringiensis]
MERKTKVLAVFLAGVLISSGGFLTSLYLSKTNLETENKKLAKQVEKVETENRRLEDNLSALRENTKDKGQEVAKKFVVSVNAFDPKESLDSQKEKVKPLVTGQAEQKLFNVSEDAHHEGEAKNKTYAEVKNMYYTKTDDAKADVIVTYDYVMVGEDGNVQKEVHNMKMNLEVKEGKWLVTDFTIQMTAGVEGL